MNRLAREKSPYLLQHAVNPVDWYPWGPEAFEKARKENKPLFLSIGYSTCHWCHVMEHESFEDEEIAALMNRHFVSIKVDREERPDIDQIYMSAVQALTGSGGWPLTVFLTPDLKPFMGGTYFPPVDRWGRIGMKSLLPKVADLWKTQADKVREAGDQLSSFLHPESSEGEIPGPDVFEWAYQHYVSRFDSQYGGFGSAPKFPSSHNLSFLLWYWKRSANDHALQMVLKTLDQMARGGMYDYLGGGFHRYSTDQEWRVPHFEKMLYDQALLARTYLEAFQITGKEFYSRIAREMLDYVLREMTDPQGGFYSAEDADSEGEEGKFYVWRPEEIEGALGPEKGRLFNLFYGVTEGGNFEHATSILHTPVPADLFAKEHSMDLQQLEAILSECRKVLMEVRRRRVRPQRDDKILTAWNGLAISAFALGSEILGEPRYLEAARGAAEFILHHLVKQGRLLRRYRDGEAAQPGFHEDYACLISGLLDLYEASFEVRWLEEAKRFTEAMLKLFWDEKSGGFFYTAADSEALIARPKEYYDGAIPSSNSTAAFLMLRLGRMLADPSLEEKARAVIHSNASQLTDHPTAFPQLLMALDFSYGPAYEAVIAGNAKSAQIFFQMIYRKFFPKRVILFHPEGEEGAAIRSLAPFLAAETPVQGRTTVYLCREYACQSPVTCLTELEKIFREI